MLSLFIRNLIFTILQPGLVTGLIPYYLLGEKASQFLTQPFQMNGFHIVGAVVFLVGMMIMILCIADFAIKGKGTLSPADPTKKLVISSLYQYSRNPMYVGVILILIGEAIFFQSVDLAVYTLVVFIAFSVFVILVEEPRLKRDFGKEYKAYCSSVRRWI